MLRALCGVIYVLLEAYQARTCSALNTHYTVSYVRCQRQVRWFKEWAKPRFKPLFHRWLIQTFPDPTRWYAARLVCARSMAVWSMVGYILVGA